MNAIAVSNIVKRFGTFEAVKGISFDVEPGEIFGLLGPNGAGKSTLIRMLTTLLPPTSGTATINGFDIVKQADGVRRSIGVIPQAMTSDLELSVEENLVIFAKLYGVPRDTRNRLIKDLLAAVELTEWKDKQVKNLSGGMRRRVEIARGLVHEPRVFFLDEPTTGLDPVSRVAVWEMLQKIKSQRDLTILITTHYMDEAERCSHVGYIYMSKLIICGAPDDLKQLPAVNPPGTRRLDVTCDHVTVGLQAVRKLAGVQTATVFGQSMHLLVDDALPEGRLRETLAGVGIHGADIRPIAPSLEDVFIHLTGKALRD